MAFAPAVPPPEISDVGAALIEAAANDRPYAVASLIAKGARVNECDDEGTTALHAAASWGCAVPASVLVACGAKLDVEDFDGDTPLYVACLDGHNCVASILIAAGASLLIAGRDCFTPLHIACENGHTSTAMLLLEAGFPINIRDDKSVTALHTACAAGNTETAAALVKSGADMTLGDKSGRTPLHAASSNGHTETAAMLLASGADWTATARRGDPPLLVAITFNHLSCVQLLSSYGASRTFTLVSTDDVRPQIDAEVLARSRGHQPIVEWLLESRLWNSPLHHLVALEPSRARALLRAGASLSVCAAPNGPTPLALAQVRGRVRPHAPTTVHTLNTVPESSTHRIAHRRASPNSEHCPFAQAMHESGQAAVGSSCDLVLQVRAAVAPVQWPQTLRDILRTPGIATPEPDLWHRHPGARPVASPPPEPDLWHRRPLSPTCGIATP